MLIGRAREGCACAFIDCIETPFEGKGCRNCGFNPIVHRRRVQKIRAKMGLPAKIYNAEPQKHETMEAGF